MDVYVSQGPPVTIAAVQIENVKRVKAVHLEPTPSGLTVIGGANGQGKTSVLDAIAWALGGARKEPTNAQRDGAISPPFVKVTLSNGIVVERKGKNSTLSVTDPTGKRSGQALLDAFISEFALDISSFMSASPKEKANTLLDMLGIGPELKRINDEETRLYVQRTTIGQVATSKRKHADELPEYADAPLEPVSVSELIRQQQDILARNGENKRQRYKLEDLQQRKDRLSVFIENIEEKILELQADLKTKQQQHADLLACIEAANKTVADLNDESTAEIEASIRNIETINSQVAANAQKAQAIDEAEQYKAQYDGMTRDIEEIRSKKLALLDSANMPLAGLSVQNSELTYNGKAWDCMSGSEQYRAAVAIVGSHKPDCGFVLVNGIEAMDVATLTEFGAWLQERKLQGIATRVSTGGECTLIIEDGLPVGETYVDVVTGIKGNDAEPTGDLW